MRNLILPAFVVFSLLASTSALAAKPVKITPGKKGVADSGDNFRNYVVQCSNGKKLPLTSWKNGKEWCIGERSTENCSKKQIKAAKGACKVS